MPTADRKTIIRHNVFSKANNAATGGNARPNLLVGIGLQAEMARMMFMTFWECDYLPVWGSLVSELCGMGSSIDFWVDSIYSW